MKFGFCGATFTGRSISADGEDVIDMYVEPIGGPGVSPKSPMVLYSRPGLLGFSTLPTVPVRAIIEEGTRCFAIGGAILYEVFTDGTNVARGNLLNANETAEIVSNAAELFIRSGTRGWIYNLAQNTLDVVIFPFAGGISSIAFIDGYFAASVNGSRQWNLSNLLDGKTWDPLMFATKEGNSDPIIGITALHDDLWLQGNETSEVWSDTGNANFPFQKKPGILLQEGLSSEQCAVVVGDTLFWIGRSRRGAGIVWKSEGFQPERVSNYSIEFLISQYPSFNDAIGYPYEEGGHQFCVWYFPAGNATLAYDLNTGMWHRRGWWNSPMGKYDAHRGRCHAYVFNKHLIGDRETGLIYEQSLDIVDDNGGPIRRLRSAPHIADENKVWRYNSLQIDMQVGVGINGGAGTWDEQTQQWGQTQVPWQDINGNAPGVDPQVMMQFSDDGGFTWSNEYWVSAGKMGQFKARAMFWALGAARDRCFRVVMTDPVKVCWVDGYLNATPGNGT